MTPTSLPRLQWLKVAEGARLSGVPLRLFTSQVLQGRVPIRHARFGVRGALFVSAEDTAEYVRRLAAGESIIGTRRAAA